MGIGDGVGDLNGDFDCTADVHRAARRLGAERLPLLKLESEIDAGVMFAHIKESRHVGMGQRAQRPRSDNQALTVDGEIDWQQAHRYRASELRVTRPIEVTWTRWLQALEQVVVSDNPERGGRRCAHVCLASMTLCTNSFASLICSNTMVMSSVGRPGCRAL
jgi:hypothetical protein